MSSHGFRRIVTLFFVGGLLAVAAPPSRAGGWILSGHGGESDLTETPVLVPLRAAIPTGTYAIEGDSNAGPIPAVVFEDGDRRWLAAVLPTIPARRPLSYRLRPQVETGPGGVRVRPAGPNLDVMVDDHLLTTYQPTSCSKPVFFPVYGPTGEMFTRSYPMGDVAGEDRDHPHHRSLWFTHGDVNKVDFWSEDKPGTPTEKKTRGSIRETARRVVVEGPALARLATRDDWLAPNGRRICRDRRTATFYRTRSVRIMDFEFVIEATDGPVTFGETKEGMFGLRVASTMDAKKKQGGKITNAEGVTDTRAWGKASPWVDYVGPVQGRTVGIAILNHPGSFRFPTTWHVRDYGLFAANPFGGKEFGRPEWGAHTIPAGESMRFAYRVILHEGDTASFGVPAHFEGYAHPPELQVREDGASGGQ